MSSVTWLGSGGEGQSLLRWRVNPFLDTLLSLSGEFLEHVLFPSQATILHRNRRCSFITSEPPGTEWGLYLLRLTALCQDGIMQWPIVGGSCFVPSAKSSSLIQFSLLLTYKVLFSVSFNIFNISYHYCNYILSPQQKLDPYLPLPLHPGRKASSTHLL